MTSGYAIFNFQPVPMAETIRLLNAETLVVCMIESLEGLRNIDEIAAVEGVDVLHVGLTDLLADMGKPGGLWGSGGHGGGGDDYGGSTGAWGSGAGVGGDNDPDSASGVYPAGGARFISTQSDGSVVVAGGDGGR